VEQSARVPAHVQGGIRPSKRGACQLLSAYRDFAIRGIVNPDSGSIGLPVSARCYIHGNAGNPSRTTVKMQRFGIACARYRILTQYLRSLHMSGTSVRGQSIRGLVIDFDNHVAGRIPPLNAALPAYGAMPRSDLSRRNIIPTRNTFLWLVFPQRGRTLASKKIA